MVPLQQRRRRRRAALPRTSERRIVVARGAGGFGFTIAGQRPCVVSAVAAGGPAERAGLRAGDALLAVDGASVARAPHASVARLVAAAPGAISLSVALREAPPTDTEDTEPDERARTRRRHPPPRRRLQPIIHQPGCQGAPASSSVNEILHNLSRAQLTPNHASRLECRAVVGYLGTIETPRASACDAPTSVRSAVRRLRQERRPATPVLLSVLPSLLLLRRPQWQVLAQYRRERIVYAGCGSDADRRYFGLVTAAEVAEGEASHSCHVFAVDTRMAEHDSHLARARDFHIACTRDPVAERCLEFPPSAEYVVGVIRGMYSLPPGDYASPTLQQISKLAVKGDSPTPGNFSRCNRAVFRVPRDRRPCRQDDARLDGPDFVANSPQPSNHSEITTTSSNSDSGIGFHNDCRNIADRILVVDFAGQQPQLKLKQEMPRRPIGVVGCSSFDADGSFLSNTTPVVDGFAGQGRPLNLDDVLLNSNELQPARRVSPLEDDKYNYNIYGNVPSTSRGYYDPVYTEAEGHYELIPPQLHIDDVAESLDSVEIYEERSRGDCHSNESVELSADSVSVLSVRSHEEARPRRPSRRMQASLDDMLVAAMRDPPPQAAADDAAFLHPSSVKLKVLKSKPLNILSRTRDMLTGRDKQKKQEARRRALSASAGDVCSAGGAGGAGDDDALSAAASEPDLRDTQSEQSSPFRRWTTGSGAGSSYRHHDHRNIYHKQMSESSREEAAAAAAAAVAAVAGPSNPVAGPSNAVAGPSNRPGNTPGNSPGNSPGWRPGSVARWSLGLDALLEDPYGVAAFTTFLEKEFAIENIIFWWAAKEYASTADAERRAELAKQIWDRHLRDGAPESVNIDAHARRAAFEGIQADLPAPDIFESAAMQVFKTLKFDSYQRFLRSPEHSVSTIADLRGLPPPFSPRRPGSAHDSAAGSRDLQGLDESGLAQDSPAGNETYCNCFEWLEICMLCRHYVACSCNRCLNWLSSICQCGGDAEADPDVDLKKSASNVSERRRIGGILPWKSRGRSTADAAGTTPPPPGASGPHHPSGPTSRPPSPAPGPSNWRPPTAADRVSQHSASEHVDVVKSAASCSLCRVVLPDGATSVVGVEPALPVRALVERLLRRRNLQCHNYDIVLKDVKKGESSTVDPLAPSSTVGGREVVVERRLKLRIDVGARAVAVRCAPGRAARHVVRPVLERFAPHIRQPELRLRDGTPVPLDTLVEELEDQRLQIVENGVLGLQTMLSGQQTLQGGQQAAGGGHQASGGGQQSGGGQHSGGGQQSGGGQHLGGGQHSGGGQQTQHPPDHAPDDGADADYDCDQGQMQQDLYDMDMGDMDCQIQAAPVQAACAPRCARDRRCTITRQTSWRTSARRSGSGSRTRATRRRRARRPLSRRNLRARPRSCERPPNARELVRQ